MSTTRSDNDRLAEDIATGDALEAMTRRAETAERQRDYYQKQARLMYAMATGHPAASVELTIDERLDYSAAVTASRARAAVAERHLANISGALMDASTVAAGEPSEYADAVRELTRERDAWHTALVARKDEDQASVPDRIGIIEDNLRLTEDLERVRALNVALARSAGVADAEVERFRAAWEACRAACMREMRWTPMHGVIHASACTCGTCAALAMDPTKETTDAR